jgi:hypothetical protein
MLFVACFVSTAPLRRTFPGIPFLSLLGRTPLVLWFSRVSEGCYRDQASAVHCLGGPQETLYNEVTILAVLRKRALFCPLIYASNDLSIPIARLYAMPKQAQPMDLDIDGGEIKSRIPLGDQSTFVAARVARGGTLLARILSRLWPVWTWPVHFPAGTRIQTLIQATPAVQLSRVSRGQLALPVAWLTRPASFFGIGMFIPQLRMQLPPPS